MQDRTFQKNLPPTSKKQSGFIMMILIVIMVLGAGVYFSQYAKNMLFAHQSAAEQKALKNLNAVKQKLLAYAVFQPELYQSKLVSNTVTYKTIDKIPGPGYLPCPDIDGDGAVSGAETNCGNPRNPSDDKTGFKQGYLPIGFSTRNIFFGAVKPKQYYYVVADRFVNGNNKYNNGTTGRYAPLNTAMTPSTAPDATPGAALPNATLPWISLNGVSGYVALIIVPGDKTGSLQPVNSDGDRFFSNRPSANGQRDMIIGISFDDWKNAVFKRICAEKGTLDSLLTTTPHWFNDYDATNIPSGGNWRSLEGGCP